MGEVTLFSLPSLLTEGTWRLGEGIVVGISQRGGEGAFQTTIQDQRATSWHLAS